jgi:hypothetical protein
MAPKMAAKGLAESMAAAPVLSGGLPPVVEAGREAEAEGVRDRVAVETVLLVPADGMMEADATEVLRVTTTVEPWVVRLVTTTVEVVAPPEEAAEETGADEPPVRPNWAE